MKEIAWEPILFSEKNHKVETKSIACDPIEFPKCEPTPPPEHKKEAPPQLQLEMSKSSDIIAKTPTSFHCPDWYDSMLYRLVLDQM